MADLGEVLAANIRAERARRDWRQIDLAQRLDVSQRTVSDMEAGREMTVRELVRLCQVLEVPASAFLRGADPDVAQALGL